MSSLSAGIQAILIFGGVIGFLLVYLAASFGLEGYRLQKLLAQRGYDSLRWYEAFRVYVQLEDGARGIPDFHVLQNYQFDGISAESLVAAYRRYSTTSGARRAGGPNIFNFLLSIPLIGYCTLQISRNAGPIYGLTVFVLIALAEFGYLMRSLQLRDALRSRGYDWAEFTDGWYLRRKLGRRFRNIPPRDQLCVTPEFRDYDPAAIVERMNAIGAFNPPDNSLQVRP